MTTTLSAPAPDRSAARICRVGGVLFLLNLAGDCGLCGAGSGWTPLAVQNLRRATGSARAVVRLGQSDEGIV